MWTQKFCLICIYILRNYAFQISNEALFLAFLQPVANRLKSFIPPSRRLGKTSSASTFSMYSQTGLYRSALPCSWLNICTEIVHSPSLKERKIPQIQND